jgi:nucleoside-diphosphate-sugar epimerase
VVQSDPPLDYVVHTASPYRITFDDPVKDCLDPAIKGTTGILKSIHAYAPTVKRVVITSSSAAMLSPPNHPKVYNESCWADVTWEQAMEPAEAYRASKVPTQTLTAYLPSGCEPWPYSDLTGELEIRRTVRVGLSHHPHTLLHPRHHQ